MTKSVAINGVPVDFLPPWDDPEWKNRRVLFRVIGEPVACIRKEVSYEFDLSDFDSEVEPDGQNDRQ